MPFHVYLHTAVIWPWKEGQYAVDGGDPIIDVNNPFEIECTVWIGDQEAPGPQGGTITVNAKANVDRPLLTNSLFWKGELEDWDPADAKQLMSIVSYDEAEDIRGGDEPTMVINLKWFTSGLPDA